MKKWKVEFEENGVEYTGWVTFYADSVRVENVTTLLVDGKEMEFDEAIETFYEVEN